VREENQIWRDKRQQQICCPSSTAATKRLRVAKETAVFFFPPKSDERIKSAELEIGDEGNKKILLPFRHTYDPIRNKETNGSGIVEGSRR
jgi:hypothetical protein